MNYKQILHTGKDKRQHASVLAFVVFVSSLAVLLWLLFSAYSDIKYITYTASENTSFVEEVGEEVAVTASSSLPQTLRIPSIQVTALFEAPLGLTPEGAVEVPVAYDTVGWYKYGPTPGEKGPAVIFGHVDTVEGPAVLYSLGQVHEGDEVYIDRADGSTVTFEILGFERVKQSEFPNDKVYGNLSYAGIRIVTCTGVFDKKSQHYSHNLIVYGKIVKISSELPSSE